MGLIVLFFLVVLVLPTLIRLAAEWPWFQALGYERVFTTRLVASVLLGTSVAVLAFAFLYANLRLALRGDFLSPRLVQISPAAPVELTSLVRRMTLPAALTVAVLMGMVAAGSWLDVLRFIHRTPFGTTDPVFGRDVAYYVFTLPVVTAALRVLTILTTLVLATTVVLYVLRRHITALHRHVSVEPPARMHLAALIAILFLLTAFRVHFVQLPGLLYSTTGPLVGASYADLHGTLMGLRLAAFTAAIGAAIVLWAARGPRLARATVVATGLYLAVSFVGTGIYPSIVNRLVVAPNELDKETPQLARHITATRRAWGLDSVRDARPHRRSAPHRGGYPQQRADHRQHPAVGPRSIAADLRAVAGDPHLLRLSLRG